MNSSPIPTRTTSFLSKQKDSHIPISQSPITHLSASPTYRRLHRGLTNGSDLRLFSQLPTKQATEIPVKEQIDVEKQLKEGELLQMDDPNTDMETSSEILLSDYAPILALLWFVALLSALDRVAMSVAILPMASEYHLSDTTKGAISSVFSVGYGLGIVPAGLLVSSVSPRLVMASGVILWSLATFGTPVAANLIHVVTNMDSMTNAEITTSVVYMVENTAPLLLMRSVMGAAESVVLPTIQRMLADWIPSTKKSGSIATVYSGFQIGTVCAYLLSPWVMENVGWRGLFYVYGGVGALWLIPWWLLSKDSPPSAVTSVDNDQIKTETVATSNYNSEVLVNTLNEENAHFVVEQRLVDENGEEALGVVGGEITTWEEASALFKDAPWKAIFSSKSTWAVIFAHAANNWGLYNFLSW